MRKLFVILLTLFSSLVSLNPQSLYTDTDVNSIRQQNLVTGTVRFGKKVAFVEVNLTIKDGEIQTVQFIEISDDKNPIRIDVLVSRLIGDGKSTKVFFDHKIIDRLVSIEFDKNFSRTGGDILITLLQNEEEEEEKISILKNDHGDFNIFFYEKPLFLKPLTTFDLELNFIGFLTFNIKDYTFK